MILVPRRGSRYQALPGNTLLSRLCLAGDEADPARALRRYESARIARASSVQQGSHARADFNHLPDGPRQRARDDVLRGADPLAANAWLYAHDPFGQN